MNVPTIDELSAELLAVAAGLKIHRDLLNSTYPTLVYNNHVLHQLYMEAASAQGCLERIAFELALRGEAFEAEVRRHY